MASESYQNCDSSGFALKKESTSVTWGYSVFSIEFPLRIHVPNHPQTICDHHVGLHHRLWCRVAPLATGYRPKCLRKPGAMPHSSRDSGDDGHERQPQQKTRECILVADVIR